MHEAIQHDAMDPDNNHGRRLCSEEYERRTLPSRRASAGRGLAAHLVAAYGTVLAPDELEQFFGEDMVRRPALPDER